MYINGIIGKKIAVHCDTEAKAKAFLEECARVGVTWGSGRPLPATTNWRSYRENTCYALDKGLKILEYCSVAHYADMHYTIIEYAGAGTVVEEHYKLSIKTKKHKVTATLYDDHNKYIKHATACCSPNDVFDYETGKKIALTRLFDTTDVQVTLEAPQLCLRNVLTGEALGTVGDATDMSDINGDALLVGDIVDIYTTSGKRIVFNCTSLVCKDVKNTGKAYVCDWSQKEFKHGVDNGVFVIRRTPCTQLECDFSLRNIQVVRK